MFIHTPTSTYPYSVGQLRRDNPQTSFPADPPPATLAAHGVMPVLPTEPPVHDPITHTLAELPPAFTSGAWRQVWAVSPLSAEQVQANQQAQAQAMQDSIVSATQDRLNAFAQTRNYDGILSLCTYATDTNPRFAAEGQCGVQSRSATWAALYQILAEVQAGQRPVPSGFADIEGDLPVLVWPQS